MSEIKTRPAAAPLLATTSEGGPLVITFANMQVAEHVVSRISDEGDPGLKERLLAVVSEAEQTRQDRKPLTVPLSIGEANCLIKLNATNLKYENTPVARRAFYDILGIRPKDEPTPDAYGYACRYDYLSGRSLAASGTERSHPASLGTRQEGAER